MHNVFRTLAHPSNPPNLGLPFLSSPRKERKPKRIFTFLPQETHFPKSLSNLTRSNNFLETEGRKRDGRATTPSPHPPLCFLSYFSIWFTRHGGRRGEKKNRKEKKRNEKGTRITATDDWSLRTKTQPALKPSVHSQCPKNIRGNPLARTRI